MGTVAGDAGVVAARVHPSAGFAVVPSALSPAVPCSMDPPKSSCGYIEASARVTGLSSFGHVSACVPALLPLLSLPLRGLKR